MSTGASNLPGGAMSSRPLHFIWIVDCSGSMAVDGKIEALNNAIRESIPHMRAVADENPNAEVLVRAAAFSSGARWHIAQPTPLANFRWDNVSADGVTDMGKAMTLVAEQLKLLPERGLPPVLVLMSDGQPTDDFAGGLRALMAQPWGKKAARVAIAIGSDTDQEMLQRFIGHQEMKPLQANNPEALVRQIRFVSTAVLQAASSPASQTAETAPTGSNVPIPAPVDSRNKIAAASDVW